MNREETTINVWIANIAGLQIKINHQKTCEKKNGKKIEFIFCQARKKDARPKYAQFGGSRREKSGKS
jgi:hypothetical protein